MPVNDVDLKREITEPAESLLPATKLQVRIRSLVSFSGMFWIMLWLSINTGPWVLRSQPGDITQWLHWIRTLFPEFILFVSVIFLILHHNRAKLPINVKLWLYYGMIGFFASALSPAPIDSFYFGVAYLAVFAVTKIYLDKEDVVESAIHLNLLSLATMTIFLLIMIFFAKDVLFETTLGTTGYGIAQRMPTVAEMPMPISSGVARFAAVPGVLSFVFIWFGKGWKRFLWLVPMLFFGWIVYFMQSRGAVIGFAFVVAFEMLFLGGKKRIVAVFFVVVFGGALLSSVIPGQWSKDVSDYMKRGQSMEEFRSMTGRTYVWKRGWQEILAAPVIGRGFQADRAIIKEHIHNTYLYALMTAGFIGGVLFVIGLIWSWLLFFLALKKSGSFDPKHRLFLVQAGGILAFFTIRGVTEVSGPLFGVDFMVMLPIMTYLGTLDQKYNFIKKMKIRW